MSANADGPTHTAAPWPVPTVAALAALGLGAPLISARDFCLDDAWIHLAFARSLRLGEGFSYNPGDLETGFSSPLWVLLLALLPPGANLVVLVKLLGLMLHAAAAALAAIVTHDIAAPRCPGMDRSPRLAAAAALLAGVLTAGLGHLLLAATSGMEASAATALLLGTALACVRGRPIWALSLACAAVLARPETLFFSATLGGMLWLPRRQPRALAAPLGAAAGLSLWVLYCLAVSGYPWPNTKYVKAAAEPLTGLAYLALEVLLQRPWVLGVTGLLVLAVGLARQRGLVRSLMAAWLVTVVAISLTREVTPGALFFHYRYFLIVAPIPIVALCASLPSIARPALRWGAAVPVLAVTLLQWPGVQALQMRMEGDIHQLHTKPALHLARTLPPGAVVLVEGAGAMRYHLPRSVRVVDVVGLSHRRIAHAGSRGERDCLLVAERPTHAAVPDEWLGVVLPLFEVEQLGRFVDEQHHSGRRVFRRQLHLLRIVAPKAATRDACGGG